MKKMKDKKVVKSKLITPLLKEQKQLSIPAPSSEKKQQKDASCEVDMISISDQMMTVLSPMSMESKPPSDDRKVQPR